MIEKLREELIKDIVSYLENKTINWGSPPGGKNLKINMINEDSISVQNNITQIIVDTFDDYELKVKGSNRFNK